ERPERRHGGYAGDASSVSAGGWTTRSRRKSHRSAFTTSGFSCCTQWPESGTYSIRGGRAKSGSIPYVSSLRSATSCSPQTSIVGAVITGQSSRRRRGGGNERSPNRKRRTDGGRFAAIRSLRKIAR